MNEFYERISNLSPKRLVLLTMELQSRLEALESASAAPTNQPIAVIGIACRFPGGADTPEAYWQLLQEGRDAISEVKPDRWDINAYFDPETEDSSKMNARWGGFISQVDQFDPALFGITPREAITMDPQQRIMLEVCWEALERAGYAPDSLTGSSTGVFVGACNNDYAMMLMDNLLENADMYLATGGSHSIISGRVSYVLGLQGPAITVDTSCSSSLVAIHYAMMSLRTGECSMALAGGVNAILSPAVTITLNEAKMMAPDGRCKAFDADADGFVRSEGCGILVLKRLADAEADGDNILAVIRGSAINQDGRSNGLTAPNGPSQVSVIRTALLDAGLTPGEVSYVETHGTGTSLGDPIEAQALGIVFGEGHSKENPLMVGSVKTNMGHLESAAGVAGLIKLILAIQNSEIPPHLHLKHLSPHIPWDDLPLTIPTARTPWAGNRVGGVSSFGFSGTNVHLIAENYVSSPYPPTPSDKEPGTQKSSRIFNLLTLSARSEKSLRALATRYIQYLAQITQSSTPSISDNLDRLAFTANTARARLSYRLAVVASDVEQARQKLAAYAADPQTEDVIHSSVPVVRPPEIAFLFTGHGAQYVQMGRQLYETEPVFRQVIDHCNELAEAYLPQPLLSALYPQSEDQQALMNTMTYGQPAIFALQVALAELWRAWGVQPAVVAGHSLGEYAAAVVAGIFSQEDGLKLVCARGRLMDHLPQSGSMASIFATEEQVAEIIQPYAADISIAVINAPTNIVISGLTPAIENALAACDAKGLKTRRLAIALGAHSPLIDPMLDEFERVAATVQFSIPRIDLVSCTTGQPVSAGEVTTPAYWRRHLRQPVQFARLMETLHARGQAIFVEIGPHPVLLSIGQRILPTGYGVWVPSLRENTNESQQMLASLGLLFVNGVEVNWNGFFGNVRLPKVILPTYAFDHQRYWFSTSNKPTQAGGVEVAPGVTPLLGVRLRSPALEAAVFETQLSAYWPPYLDHHRIFGTSIAPSPAYIEMAIRAAEELFGDGSYSVSNLAIQEALILPDEGLRTVQIILTSHEDHSASFKIVSLGANDQWITHSTGEVARQEAPTQSNPDIVLRQITEAKERCTEQITGPDYYTGVAGLGLEFGESFRGLQQIWRRDGEAVGQVQLPDSLLADAKNYHFHPALLDACFHLLDAPLPGDTGKSAYLLTGIEHFRLYRPPTGLLWNHITLHEHAGEIFVGHIRLCDEAGNLVAEAQGLSLKRANRQQLLRAVRPRFDDWFYHVEWQPRPLPLGTRPASGWYILPDQGDLGHAVVERLTAEFENCHLLQPGETAPGGANVIYLAGLDADSPSGKSAEDLSGEAVAACRGALEALQPGMDVHLWIITRAAQPVDSSPVNPGQAALWGLGRVIALEHPDSWGGLIDLDPGGSPAEQAASLVAEIRAGDVEDQVAYRGNQRYIARLTRTAAPATPVYTFAPDAAYWITGGLGGLGLVTARWIAEQGARYIVLSGRHGLPDRAEWDALPTGSRTAEQVAVIQAIESLGAVVDVAVVDIGDATALESLINTFGVSRPALRGIFHAAASLSNRLITELNANDLHTMFWPKIAGTWSLHTLTRELKLDFFVLFSTTTALWGSNQLGHYAAANTFLDAFAHYRHSLGLPVLSVNWGAWEVMRVASQAEQQRVVQFGLEQMPAEAALTILGNLLTSDLPQITVAAVDWSSLKAAYEFRRPRPLLEGLESRKVAVQTSTEASKVLLADRLRDVKLEERRAFIVEHVRQQVAKVISAPDPADLNIRQGLFEMGLDSLMSVELKSRLEASVGQSLPSTLTFNYPTIADLARYLDETVLASSSTLEPAVPAIQPPLTEPTSVPAEPADNISEDELANLLAAKLSKLK